MPPKFEPQPDRDEAFCDYAGALHPDGCTCGAVEVED